MLWASGGRSAATRARAEEAGLSDVGTIAAVAAKAGTILSVCPPHAATDLAWAVHGFRGLYVDANAVSPGTAREVAQMITDSGGRYVDGGIIGPPPVKPGTTRLYLSGPDAEQVRALFAGSPLDARVIDGAVIAASAVKMAYGAWTKGTAALILAIREFAKDQRVEEALLAEWALSQPKLEQRSQGSARAATAKGWRWVAEMEEIASAFSSSGLPDGFHQAAAEIFRRYPRSDSA